MIRLKNLATAVTSRNARRHSRTALRPCRGHIFRVSTYTLGLANGLYLAPLTAMINHSGALRGILGTLSTPLVARTRRPTTKSCMNARRLVPPFGGPQQKPRYGRLAEPEDQQSCKPREGEEGDNRESFDLCSSFTRPLSERSKTRAFEAAEFRPVGKAVLRGW